MKDFDKLAEHYLDYTGTMNKTEIIAMLKERAVRKEMSYYDYEFKWLPNLKKNHWISSD